MNTARQQSLTAPHPVAHAETLQHEFTVGVCMRGQVISRQKCKVCGEVGKYEEKSFGLVCECGQFQATKPQVEIYWQSKRLRITHDQQGRRFESYEHAKRALGLIRNQIEQKAFYPELWRSKSRSELLWPNYVSAYLSQLKDHTTYSNYKNKRWALHHLAPYFDRLNVRDIRAAHIEDAAAQLAQIGLSIGSQRNILATLAVLLNRAYHREDIERSLRVTLPVPPHNRIQYLTPDQQAAVLVHIPPKHKPIFRFLFFYGVRVGEACGLCWDAIDLDRGEFWITRTFSNNHWTEATKTRRDRPLPVMDWFADYLASIPRGFPSLPVFANPSSRRKERNYSGYISGNLWRQAAKAAGLEPIKLKNATRHSVGFRLRTAGADMDGIAGVLGHSQTRTTKAYVEDDTAMAARLLTAQRPPKTKNG